MPDLGGTSMLSSQREQEVRKSRGKISEGFISVGKAVYSFWQGISFGVP